MIHNFFHHINYWGILLGFLISFISSAIWFGPKTFYPIWVKARGHQSFASNANPNQLRLFGSTIIALIIQVFAIAFFVTNLQFSRTNFHSYQGAEIGFILGLGISAFSSLGHRLFGGETFKSWAIECGIDVINMTITGFVIAVLN
jgi:Protein of unknown function (DUF1761)